MLFPSGRMETTATTKHLVTVLARAGYNVDVFTARNAFVPPPVFHEPGVTLFVHPHEQRRAREFVPTITLSFLFWFLPFFFRRRYAMLLAAGIRGLYVASFLHLFTGIPYIYHCLELYPSWDRTSLSWKLYKLLERHGSRNAALCVVQDELRGKILVQDNGVDPDSLAYFPVSTFGPGKVRRSDYLRKKYGIPDHKRIVLCAGAIFVGFVPGLEIVKEAQRWPEDVVLVMHSNGASDPAVSVDEFKSADKAKRVIFSLEPVAYELLPELIASADIGLAVYSRYDDNIVNMGLSSGKLAEYAALGVPFIVNDFPGIGERVNESRPGVAIDSIDELSIAVQHILSDYDGYCARAVEFFDRELAAERYAPQIVSRVNQLLNKRPR